MKRSYGQYSVSVCGRAGGNRYCGGLVAFGDDKSVFALGDGEMRLRSSTTASGGSSPYTAPVSRTSFERTAS